MSGGLSLAGDFTMNTVGVPSDSSGLNRIEPGDHNASYLWHKLNGTQGEVGGGSQMPRRNCCLSEAELTGIGAWIDSL